MGLWTADITRIKNTKNGKEIKASTQQLQHDKLEAPWLH